MAVGSETPTTSLSPPSPTCFPWYHSSLGSLSASLGVKGKAFFLLGPGHAASDLMCHHLS